MENPAAEYSELLWHWKQVSQMAPKEKALWNLERDIQMLEDWKNGQDRPAQLALWVLQGWHHFDRILARGTTESIQLESNMRTLLLLAQGLLTNASRPVWLPAIDSASKILRGCKATLETWTDKEATEKLGAIILKFPDGSAV